MKITHYLSLLCGLLIFSSGLQAADNSGPESGSFLVRSAADQDYQPALLLGTDVEVKITGPVARVVVRQQFYNQSDTFVEGKYVFPLPEDAAINAMTLLIGERVINGEIHEKQQAQKIYQQALQQGKHAGLIEQQRANLFTTQVANIAPKEAILVEITYIETLTRTGNEFSFYFPMTLTPRYLPPAANNLAESLGSDFIFAQDLPAELANPARIHVQINNVKHLSSIESNSHTIVTQEDKNAWQITTKDSHVPMDRDFKLRWKIASINETTPAFFVDQVDGSYYGLLMLMPPENPSNETILARETIFIIDTSGSMGGESIAQAKASLIFAIEHLTEQQRFNIIEFNSIHSKLFALSEQATASGKQQAVNFVNSLQATGGTEMAPALRSALTLPSDPEYLRQVIFITDGAVGNEDELFGIIHQLLGDSRLFTVGIGSAPNGYFMKKAAELGRGTQTLISQLSDVNSAMSTLFTQLEKPLLRDIQVTFPDTIHADIYPQKIPDLYVGEPILLALKLSALPATISIIGEGHSTWSRNVYPQDHSDTTNNNATGIASLWARAKIESLSERMRHEANPDTLKREIIDVAFTHQLVSQFTSFVAVEEVISRAPETDIAKQNVANLLPKGTAISHTAAYPSTATGIELLWLIGVCMLLAYGALTIYCRRSQCYV
ncbi:marine proteobacterial sortase target protein [Cellvibrio sp. OA-2007]|uniref:marine proteobacterial sortase target protein n=1 Tax=Cellvibrio sp. OA-2007 TaxID=529823 RepID=UPI000781F9EF|nr:marine proteobacterial sortase target protein [Cellvibrio sp. OA-2007]